MKRTKPPVLTSPWKIGFFVSLMLVFVAIGVTFFFARSLGTPWLPQLSEWRSILTSVAKGQGVFVNVWPGVVLVGLTSLFSYMVVTQAVRKYKRYLDSGQDYKRLLADIRDIEDIDDAEGVAALHNHDELREFLNKIRHQHENRANMLDEREKALESSVIATEKKKEAELTSDLNEQCGRLIEGIVRGFAEPTNITFPELKLVEEAVRDAAEGGQGQAGKAAASDNAGLQESVKSAWNELEAMTTSARELESELTQMTGGEEPAAASGEAQVAHRDLQALAASFTALGGIANQLGMLGEESKRVAINTALRAGSGDSSHDDLVSLAEDVKEVATQYGEMSKVLSGEIENARRAARSIHASVQHLAGGSGQPPHSLGALSSKVSLLSERMMLVTERFRGALGERASGSGSMISGDHHLDDSSFEKSDNEPRFRAKKTEFGAAFDNEIESYDESNSIFSHEDDSMELSGIESNTSDRFAASQRSAAEAPDDGMFAELSDQQPEVKPDRMSANQHEYAIDEPTPPPSKSRPKRKAAEKPAPRESGVDMSGLELDTGFGTGLSGVEPGELSSQTAIEEEVEDSVLDLYAIGAVDYDPAVHS